MTHDVPEDLEDLVNLRVTREERLARAHLSEDATDRPHVNTSRVLSPTKQNLWRAVPECDDLYAASVGVPSRVVRDAHLMGICPEWHTKSTSKTEICQLEVTVLVDQQVLRLQVTMQNSVGMAVAHALAQLHHEPLDHRRIHDQLLACQSRTLWKSLSTPAIADRQRFHVLLEIEVEEFEYEVELVAVGVHDVQQADNVGVVHLLEQGDLTDRGRRHALIFGLETDLLERNNALVLGCEVAGLVDNSVGSC